MRNTRGCLLDLLVWNIRRHSVGTRRKKFRRRAGVCVSAAKGDQHSAPPSPPSPPQPPRQLGACRPSSAWLARAASGQNPCGASRRVTPSWAPSSTGPTVLTRGLRMKITQMSSSPLTKVRPIEPQLWPPPDSPPDLRWPAAWPPRPRPLPLPQPLPPPLLRPTPQRTLLR